MGLYRVIGIGVYGAESFCWDYGFYGSLEFHSSLNIVVGMTKKRIPVTLFRSLNSFHVGCYSRSCRVLQGSHSNPACYGGLVACPVLYRGFMSLTCSFRACRVMVIRLGIATGARREPCAYTHEPIFSSHT